MGLFAGIKDARSSQGGNYLDAGFKYKLEVLKLTTPQSWDKNDLFIAELRVVESNNPRQPAGATVSWVLNFTKHPLMAPGNFKAFMQALTGVNFDNEVDDPPGTPNGKTAAQKVAEFCDTMVSAANPCKGKLVGCETFLTKTKGKGSDFTKHLWEKVAA